MGLITIFFVVFIVHFILFLQFYLSLRASAGLEPGDQENCENHHYTNPSTGYNSGKFDNNSPSSSSVFYVTTVLKGLSHEIDFKNLKIFKNFD